MHKKYLAGIIEVLAVMALALCLALLPRGAAYANEEPGDPAPEEADASWDYRDGGPTPVATNRHSHTMEPGDTYDVGSAGKNTTVYIDQPGRYRLKGSSKYVRVLVRSGGVELYLADGLSIDPGIYSNVGASTAAITIEEQGGTVRLISEPGADVYMGGYYYAPAIRKDGETTKLIFETLDPSQPGTITAYRSKTSHSAGIGSVYYLVGGGTCGNMEFKSGNIVATGGVCAAGIGCGSGNKCARNLTFSGANVTATGLDYGAGIGGGLSGSVDKITISGGTIVASGESGAGIGGGRTTNSYDGRCGTITITGGDVTATSKDASGIGCGVEGNIKHIKITGGTIHATGRDRASAGIGGTGSNFYGRCAQIDISGGTIYATGGSKEGVGIGSALCGEGGDTTINISGGYIEAEGSYSIGGGGQGNIFDKGHLYVNISGGTILTGPIPNGSIGSRYDMTCTITGGSLRCGDVDCTPTDGKGNNLTLMNVQILGASKGSPVTQAEISGLSNDYGLHDVVTADGNAEYTVFYPWFPLNTETTMAKAGEEYYYGDAKTSEGFGQLSRATHISLQATAPSQEPGLVDGFVEAGYQRKQGVGLIEPKRPGYTVKGYATMKSAGVNIMEPDGTFHAGMPDYTDSEGRWQQKGGDIFFYTVWNPNEFTVAFDGNLPENASTTLSGTMEDQTFKYGETEPLTACGYTLIGYDFVGWNTAADGSGTPYDDAADGSKLTQEAGAKITLYAQWKPITYTVTFNGDGGTGSMAAQTMTFDQPAALSANQYTYEGKVFAGWTLTGHLGSHYSDQEVVENLIDASGAVVDLTAMWADEAQIMIKVTLDGAPVEGCTIGLNDGSMLLTVDFDYANGVYSYDGTEIPAGIYEVYVDGYATGQEISTGEEAAALQSASPQSAEMMQSSEESAGLLQNASEETGEPQSDPSQDGTDGLPSASEKEFQLVQAAAVDDGMLFLSYYSVSVAGDDHTGSVDLDPTDATQVIFDGSGKTGWLLGSEFVIEAADWDDGYLFLGWQSPGVDPTWMDGTDAWDDPATIVINGNTRMLASAQPVTYTVGFSGNAPEGASTKPEGTMDVQHYIYDTAEKLPANEFTLEGYDFVGWNTAADGSGTAYADEAEVKNLTDVDEGEVTLYAQWAPITYEIIFNNNFGTGMMPAQKLTFDKPDTLCANQFGYAYRHFTGWNTDPGGAGTTYGDGAQVLNLTSEKDAKIVLYAQWEHDVYTVEYNSNGEGEDSVAVDVWCGETGTVADCMFAREHYTFLGWNTAADGSGKSYAPGDEFPDLAPAGGRVVLYAQWKVEKPAPDPDDPGKSAKTGDGANAWGWMLLMLAAGAVLCISKSRKTDINEN